MWQGNRTNQQLGTRTVIGCAWNGIATPLLCCFSLFFLSPWFAHAQEEEAPQYTLEDCIRIGLARASSLRAAGRDLEIARQEIRSVRAAVYPSLTLNANYTRLGDVPDIPAELGFLISENNYSASFDAEQLLYGGGAVRAALRIAGYLEDAAEVEVRRSESALMRDITRSFYEILFLQEAVGVAEQFIEQLEAIEAQAAQRYRAETGSEFDWLNAQVALANERPTLIAARNALSLARRAFRDLVRLEEESFSLAGDLDLTPSALDREQLLHQAEENRPELHVLRAQLEVARNREDVALSRYRPEINAFASYAGVEPSQRDPFSQDWQWEWLVGVRATWGLFDGGRRGADLQIERLGILQIEDALEDLLRATRLQVDQLWLLLEEKRETLMGTAENIRLAERALAIASVRYEQGLATWLDVTESNLALNHARLNHHQALLEYRQAFADLEHVVGIGEIAGGAGAP